MSRLVTKIVVPLSLVAVLAMPLASRPALAQATGAEGAVPTPTQEALSARELAVGNPSVLSNTEFTVNPDLLGAHGSFGGAVGPLGTGTENFPPGANGAEPPGSSANGSMMGGFGG
ncbi:MAG: hypothetical protein ACLQJR_34000 [Stellaceae bacterium]